MKHNGKILLQRPKNDDYAIIGGHGKLNEHLHEVEEECYERMELLVEQMKAWAGITEELKARDQIK